MLNSRKIGVLLDFLILVETLYTTGFQLSKLIRSALTLHL